MGLSAGGGGGGYLRVKKSSVRKNPKIPNHQAAPEGIWVPGGGIEIPCTYKLYGAKCTKRMRET